MNITKADAVVYALFAMAGVGVMLPGNLLPILLARWAISDGHAGLLFFLFFLASTAGALLSRGSLPRSMARGCALIAVGMGMLAVASRTTAFLAMLLYGLGLGIAMTSTSLRQSRQYPEQRTAQMARLNFIWAVGAVAAPLLVLRGAATWGANTVLFSVAAAFAVLAILAWWLIPAVSVPPPAIAQQGGARAVPWLLFAMVPLATGIESGTGGWLTTYSNRSGHVLNVTITAVTCLWAGMLLSRLVQSHGSVAKASRRPVLMIAPSLIAAALVLMLYSGNTPGLLGGALLLGLAIGPVYPLLIALFLDRGEAGNSVFVLGGIGAALFPWLAGLLSTWSGSLREGMSILVVASIALAAFGMMLSSQHTPLDNRLSK